MGFHNSEIFTKNVHSQNCEVICSALSIYTQVLHATYRSVNVSDSGQRPETSFTQVRRREHLADTLQAQFPNVCAINPYYSARFSSVYVNIATCGNTDNAPHFTFLCLHRVCFKPEAVVLLKPGSFLLPGLD